ncbi:SET domain-containing protein 4-like isoform X2 [Saccostrea echinata]|uniref:SET domain-containing protein 4-like isoform X2 n=1 Tax=Saccostrea echinata TaxID=191078 RepID=UPI002A839BC2|nr:SET domain-containing protein 4-like isoform X2 [Saccostrea echinata]
MRRLGRTKRTRRKKRTNKPVIDFSEEIVGLSKWMKKESKTHGFKWRSILYPANFLDTGRGMMTRETLHPGDTIVSIPQHLLITVETVLSSSIGELVKRQKLKLSSQQLLSLFLLSERNKGDNSYWHPYIATLPMTHTTIGYFSARELTLFPQKLRKAAESRISDIKQAYFEVKDFHSGETILYEDFLWAWFCVNSRSVFYRLARSEFVREDGNNLALAPYLDLLNHSVEAQVDAGFNEKTGCYEIITHNSYRKCSQVFISYGSHDNSHLLVEYGFTLPDNPNDALAVDYDVLMDAAKSLDVSYTERKQDIIQTNNLHRKLACTVEGLSWNLLMITRILAMDWTELQNWKVVLQGGVISTRNERLSRNIARSFLTQYIQQNQGLISKFPPFSSMNRMEKLIFSVVQTERNILHLTWTFLT